MASLPLRFETSNIKPLAPASSRRSARKLSRLPKPISSLFRESDIIVRMSMTYPNSRRRGLPRLLDQALRRRARLSRDLGARQHAGDLLEAFGGAEVDDAGDDPVAVVDFILDDLEVPLRARGDLRCVGHREHLRPDRQPGEA